MRETDDIDKAEEDTTDKRASGTAGGPATTVAPGGLDARHGSLAPHQDRFDGAWKYLLEEMFPEFLWFYFPDVAQAVDWDVPVTASGDDARCPWRFLNQELQQIHPEAEVGNRAVDKLVEVRLHTGESRVLFVHIEVQSQPDRGFAERMFVYHYRIFDRFRQPVTSLAVLGDANPKWRPDAFALAAPGMTHRLAWPTVKLLDYAKRERSLKGDDNPFAWVTLAHLAALRTRGRLEHRQDAKLRLMRLALSHGWDRERIIGLLRALEFMMRLPPELNRPLRDELETALGGNTVELLFSWEEEALKRGRQEGLAQGMEKGMEKGREAEAALIARQLVRRFGPLPEDVARKVRLGSFEELDRWGFRLLDASTIEEVFAE